MLNFKRVKALGRLLSSRQLCIWLIQPQSSQVKKYRLSLSQALLCGGGVVVSFLLIVALTGDYARVQVMRLKHYVSYIQIRDERDSLLEESTVLRDELTHLQRVAGERSHAHEQLRSRVYELRALVSSAQDMGAIPPEFGFGELRVDSAEARAQMLAREEQADHALGGKEEILEEHSHQHFGDADDGVGGAEYPCLDAQCLLGPSIELDSSVGKEVFETHDLVLQLDELVSALSMLPIGSPISGHVSSNFGPRRSPFTGRTSLHAGVDFSAPQGAAVLVTAEGIVTRVGRNATYGLYVDVEHSPDVLTRYAHLSKITVTEGEEVCRGDMLGLVGSTGRSTGPHLHYELRIRGKAVNPTFFLALPEQLAALIDDV